LLRIVQIAVVVVVMVAATYWLVQDLDWVTIGHTLGSARPLVLLGVVGLLLVNHVARSLRLRPLVGVPIGGWDLVRLSAVSFLAIQVLPLRLGELLRPQLLLRYGVPFGEGLGAIAVDRILDVWMLLGLMGLVAFVVPLPTGAIEVGGVDVVAAGQRASAALVVLGTGGFVALAVAGRRLQQLVARIPVVGGTSAILVGGVVESLRRLAREPRSALVAVGWSVLSWCTTVLIVWLALHAFDGLPTALAASMVLWTAIACAMSVLPTPGFFGPFEAAGVAALAVFGADPVIAKAFVLFFHVLLLAFAFAIALLSMISLRLSLSDLRPRLDPADQSTPR